MDEYLNGRRNERDLLKLVGQHEAAGCPLFLTASQKVPSLKSADGQFSEDRTENTHRNGDWILCSKMPLNTENETFSTFALHMSYLKVEGTASVSLKGRNGSKIDKTDFSQK